jgi:hypothetical protein
LFLYIIGQADVENNRALFDLALCSRQSCCLADGGWIPNVLILSLDNNVIISRLMELANPI